MATTSSSSVSPEQSLRVLVAVDGQDAKLLLYALRQAGFRFIARIATTSEKLQENLRNSSFDIIFCGQGLVTVESLDAVRQLAADTPIILVNAGLAEDLTARRELEEQLRQAQKIEPVGWLAGSVAHEFNNLLMVIRGYTELLLDRLGNGDDLRGNAVNVLRAAERATVLTQKLLAFSRKQQVAAAGSASPRSSAAVG